MGNQAPVCPPPIPFPRGSCFAVGCNLKQAQGESRPVPLLVGAEVVPRGGHWSALMLNRWVSGWVLVSRIVTTYIHTCNWMKKITQLLETQQHFASTWLLIYCIGYWFTNIGYKTGLMASNFALLASHLPQGHFKQQSR